MRINIVQDVEHNVSLERWLRTTGVARYDAYHRAPKCLSAAKVFARLRRHHSKRVKKAQTDKTD